MKHLFYYLLLIALMTSAASSQWQPGDPITDSRDGQTYRTVVIGTQVWMAENLNFGTMVPSTAPGAVMKNNGVIEKCCWNNDQQECDGAGGKMKRGGFYEWEEAVQYWSGQPKLPVRGICPEGWRIPSNAEWNTLLAYLGGATAYTKMLKGGSSGFDALLTGYRCTMNGSFRPSAMSADYRTYFWTAEQTDASNAPFIELGQNSLTSMSFLKSVGLCVRCIYDGVPNSIEIGAAPSEFMIQSVYIDNTKRVNVAFTGRRSTVLLTVYDVLGRTLATKSFEAINGENHCALDISSASRGTYFVSLVSDKKALTHKFTLSE